MQTRIKLRDFRSEDVELNYVWTQDQELKKNFQFTYFIKSKEDIARFVQMQIEGKDSKVKHFVMYDKTDVTQTYIGSVGLKNIDVFNKNAEITIVLSDKNYIGKGYGQEALYLICEYGFKKLNLHKIYLGYIAHNEQAGRAYAKFGFKVDGVKREHILQEDVYYNEPILSMLQSEFEHIYDEHTF
jgi:RimJ/RimL family protein N-acetyltransferase